MVMKQDNQSVWASVDWVTFSLYLALMAFGWLSICGASYDFSQGGNFFSLDTRSGMQVVWIGTSLLLGSIILLTNDKIYDTFAYLIYAILLVLLFITPFLARDIKGSHSWIKIGPFSLQAAEFAKFATALAVAKFMSSYGYNIARWRDFGITLLLIFTPMLLIIAQRETGSALVYFAFFLMLYREGMPGSILFAGISAVIYFVVGVRFADTQLWHTPTSVGEYSVLLLIMAFTLGMIRVYHKKSLFLTRLVYWTAGINIIALAFSLYVIPFNLRWIQLPLCIGLILCLLYQAFSTRISKFFYISIFTLGSLTFFYSVDFVLNNVLEAHQQIRIKVLLGLEDDPTGAGYNVNQAKIAIGSGGLKGKGFLNGTQTKLKYVPEQDTDFIFCTVGEEEGFLGSAAVLLLFLCLILRLIYLAERQPYRFGRIYGYCVLSVFLFHLFINVGMVLGLTPVIGIPLPFFSYGGSSLWGFTILLFIFLRIDASRTLAQR